jgi:hypothetical protein
MKLFETLGFSRCIYGSGSLARKNKNARKIQITETESRDMLDYTELEIEIQDYYK